VIYKNFEYSSTNYFVSFLPNHKISINFVINGINGSGQDTFRYINEIKTSNWYQYKIKVMRKSRVTERKMVCSCMNRKQRMSKRKVNVHAVSGDEVEYDERFGRNNIFEFIHQMNK
jgi:hypothetical protein